MTMFGPGSEWFWAAAQFVLVAVSLLGIYRQLKAQGSANAMERLSTLHERWNSERLVRARLELAIKLRHAEGKGIAAGVWPVADFFEDIALLDAGGHVSKNEIWLNWNRTIELWWIVLKPEIERQRAHAAGEFSGFERLAGQMVATDLRNGQVNEFGTGEVQRILDSVIESLTEGLRQDLEAREGRIPTIPRNTKA